VDATDASSTAVIEKIARAAAATADDLLGDLTDEQIRKLARACLVAKLEAAMHSAIRK
jgi:hypothetical protein